MWCTVLWRTSRGTPEGRVRSGNSARSLPACRSQLSIFGNRVDAVWAYVDRDVTPSNSLLFRQSTKRLKLARKSAPMIGS